MYNIEIVMNNNQPVVSSRQIAHNFGKNHRHVLDSIRNLVAENSAAKSMFYETTFDNRGKQYPMYLMNRDGFSLLVMGFTGKKALEWKIRYINAFNAMEEQIRKNTSKRINETKQKEIDARYMNAKSRMANVWLKLADRVPNNKEYQQICGAYASAILAGRKVLPLPSTNEKYYSATEVGKMLGISANKVGRIANSHSLKIEANGKYFFDKSKHSNKEVQTFKYNQSGIEAIKKLL